MDFFFTERIILALKWLFIFYNQITLDAEVQLLRQLMFGKDNATKVDEFWETNH